MDRIRGLEQGLKQKLAILKSRGEREKGTLEIPDGVGQFLSCWSLGGCWELFCSVAVVITASESLRDITNFRENGTLISVRTLRLRLLISASTYRRIKPRNSVGIRKYYY